jgi:hypothetical protein
MMSFSYIARTADGTLERGNIDAPTMEKARETLRKKHLDVEEMRAADAATPSISFTQSMPWTVTDEPDGSKKTPKKAVKAAPVGYIPLVDTLRLFAGWLLAWYGVIYVLGSLQLSGKISTEWPFVQGLFESALVLRFTFATFMFLMLSTIHRAIKGAVGSGIALSVVGVVLVMLFHLNA